MPLVEQLFKYEQERKARFHVPGHKGKDLLTRDKMDTLTSVYGIDVTEIEGMDDFHHPEGVIREAQELAAKTFFSDRTFFLVNGSTVGNLAMILAFLKPNDQVFVQRNSHKSIFNGLIMAKAKAIFLEPEICTQFSVPMGVSFTIFKEAVRKYPSAKAIILTNPNYYGMATDLKEIIEFAHQQGILVLIDEAHGAHFGQAKNLPPSAMQLGADAVVQSTHKMLPSMTMSSMLHVQGDRFPMDDLQFYLQMLQSSSPSYPLMASLDYARYFVDTLTEEDWEKSWQEYASLRLMIKELGYQVSGTSEYEINDIKVKMDPFKLTIKAPEGITGYAFLEELGKKGVVCEMADPLNVLLTLPLIPMNEWNHTLVSVLKELSPVSKTKDCPPDIDSTFLQQPRKQKISEPFQLKKYTEQEKVEINLEQAIGRRGTEMLIPYPPGIPLMLPGEIVTEELVTEIYELQEKGAYFQGKNKGFKSLKVEV